MSSVPPNGHMPRVDDVTLESIDPVDMFLAGILSLLRIARESNLSHQERLRLGNAAELITFTLQGMDKQTALSWNLGMVQILVDAAAPDKEDGPRRN